MKTNIILGLGYGDEGKGITTDYLCQQSFTPLVIRFSGGHQAGHTVVTEDGKRHIFSSFGAGTLRNIPSYWSRYCTLFPLGFYNELLALNKVGVKPEIYVDAKVMITTPYDIFFNQNTEKTNGHGSCGVGFGATIERNEGPCKLYAQDLFYPVVLEQKLRTIRSYYERKINDPDRLKAIDFLLENYFHAIEAILPIIKIVHEKTFFESVIADRRYDQLIFEGSQGILLDMDYGFFPNVTRANTTSKQALEIIENNLLPNPTIYYVTRAYQTRHGNGFLSNESYPLELIENPNETNQYNEWQGHQRRSILDIDLINYAIQCDLNHAGPLTKNLVITCMDQLRGSIQATKKGKIHHFDSTLGFVDELALKPDLIIESHSDCSADMVVKGKGVMA